MRGAVGFAALAAALTAACGRLGFDSGDLRSPPIVDGSVDATADGAASSCTARSLGSVEPATTSLAVTATATEIRLLLARTIGDDVEEITLGPDLAVTTPRRIVNDQRAFTGVAASLDDPPLYLAETLGPAQVHLYDSRTEPHTPLTTQPGLAARPALVRTVGDGIYMSYAERNILHLVALNPNGGIENFAEPTAVGGALGPGSAALISTGAAAPALIGAWGLVDDSCWVTRADEDLLAFPVDALDPDCQGVRLAAFGDGAVVTYVAPSVQRGRAARLGAIGADVPLDLGPANEVRVATTDAAVVLAVRSGDVVTVSRGPSLTNQAPVAVDLPAGGRISAFELATTGPTGLTLFVVFASGELWTQPLC